MIRNLGKEKGDEITNNKIMSSQPVQSSSKVSHREDTGSDEEYDEVEED